VLLVPNPLTSSQIYFEHHHLTTAELDQLLRVEVDAAKYLQVTKCVVSLFFWMAKIMIMTLDLGGCAVVVVVVVVAVVLFLFLAGWCVVGWLVGVVLWIGVSGRGWGMVCADVAAVCAIGRTTLFHALPGCELMAICSPEYRLRSYS
jgi:hypothetical protein